MRALGRWTPFLVLLSSALLLEVIFASGVPTERRKRQAKPFDDEVLEPREVRPTQNRTPDPRYRPDSDPRYRQDPQYRQRQDTQLRYPDPRQDPRYVAQQQERTPPPRRVETPRYDPRTEAFLAELPSDERELDVSESRQFYQEYTSQRRRIFTEFDELGEEKGNWTEWDASAPCSRSCGGGVTFKKRTCLEEPCDGPTRIYSTCNKHDCPKNETQEDFLLRQCQRMNSVPHEGRYYSWIVRRRHDRNPCELNCSPRDRDLELRARHNVIDGTRCYHAGFDQCVDGQCVPTGCDGLLGSRKRIDKCLVCGGENKNCNTTVHSENRVQLPSGYVPILVIPKGATSIMVRESHVTRNYISLRDLNGTSYLNKVYEIDSSKAFIAGGARFHYTRNQQYMNGREFLRADGPTNETLVVVLLVQEMNRGFEIEFSLKEVPGQPRPRSGEFQWQKSEWDPCTDPCGERNTTRVVRCASIITNLDAQDIKECDAAEEPPSMKTCPVDNCQSEWYTGNWERCSDTCGNGTQTRAVFCSTAAGEGVRVLPDRLCKDKGERPPSQQDCTSNESCDKWEAGEWGESEKKCGATKVTREVTCIRQMENSTEGVEIGQDCLEDLKPAAEKEVLLEPCTGVEWATSEWTACTECGSSVQTRRVECVNEEGRVYEDSHCSTKPKPETEQPCADSPMCEYRWFTSEWSSCSATCGSGVQSRLVFCASFDQNATTATAVDATNCQGTAPAQKQACQNAACEHVWLSAPWNKQCPENACGGVPRKRLTFCHKDGKIAEDCPEDQKPKETDDCSPQACPADQINVLGECVSTEHGCCPDGTSVAGPEFTGCPAFDRENFTVPCAKTEWGCCRDLVTPAFGPFDGGCALFALCNGTEHGCCQDGETRAAGPNFQGCVVPCDKSFFGCCPDGVTAASEEDQVTGCPPVTTETLEEGGITTFTAVLGETEDDGGSGGSGGGEIEGSGEEIIEPNCADSEHGCCADNVTSAKNADKRRGCVHCRASKYGCCPDGVTAALGRKFKGCEDVCTNSTYGCCPDGFSPSNGPSNEGCKPVECKNSKYGCCGKLKIPAAGPQKKGCNNCTESVYGCCANNEDFALGLNSAGCCADSPFGCCPDNVTLAQGPDLAGCPCTTLKFGCCLDKVTPALGLKFYGCSCENSEFGCCPDLITPALGPAQANCTCDRTAFGCCPDGVTVALGPDTRKSCDCRISPFGCCPDGKTAATGKSQRGCYCNSMKYGCCPDNHTPAAGPNYLGCPCRSTHYGCCPDGVTHKLGPRNEGCEDCTKLKYGCCPDGDHAARGPDFQGCPCDSTEFGCCPDRVTASKGKDNEGCPEVPCHQTEFGCCPDRTAAKGRDFEGCALTEEERRRYEEQRRGVDTRRRQPGEYAPPTRPPYYEPKRTREACFQSEDRGQCGNWTLVFYYNSQNATCQMFYYGGCGGNDNRFPDMETCMSLCQNDRAAIPKNDYVPPIDTNEVIPSGRRTERYPCDLPKDAGPCRGSAERFWYNQNTNRCERFIYGCQGNDNRFFTHKACTERCKVLSTTEKCTLPKVISRNCSDPRTLFRYNYKLHRCDAYKGCTEDTNVFLDYHKCVSTCQNMTSYGSLDATVCALPKDPGPCSEYTAAWAFEEGRCVPFHYGGCEGNSNRFESKDDCESTCNRHGSQPGPTDVGGTQSRTPSSVHLCEQPREVGPCQNFEARYYYDSAARTCFSFNYGGCGGNMNNFMTMDDCQRQCAYRHGGLAPQQPRSSTFNVRDCQMPKDRGTCTGSSAMFYYNPNDGVCREFTYSGCGGNNNRFTTRHECERSCKNAQNRCQLPTIKGRCGGAYKMWTYDTQKDICKQFDYSGCYGNANRFDSKAECEKSCVRGAFEVTGISSDFPEKCRLKADSGGCAHSLPKFYFDLRLGKCLPFLWGGCEGNDNRFETFNDCQKDCTIPAIRANLIKPNREDSADEYEAPPNKQEVCTQPARPGHGECADAQQVVRFYYDAQSERCLQFPYQGCDGNKNNFVSPEKCYSFCDGIRSQRNDATLIDPRRPSSPDRCPPDNCGTLDCRGMGERREALPNGCSRCVCKHPCDGVRCGTGDKCAVQVSQNSYIGICRPISKPGQCPKLSCDEKDRGKNYCVDDSSCEGLKKCCNTGCNLVCSATSEEDADVDEVVVVDGGATSLTCPMARLEGSPLWTKNGKDVEGERFDQVGMTLRIAKASAKDAGVYECVNDDDPSMKGKIALRIAAPPKIIKENPVVESVPAATANLSCTVIGGFPRPSIIWSRNDTRLPSRSHKYKQLPENTLQILDVDEKDQDLYLCTASNVLSRAQFMVALIIPVQGNDDHQSKGQELAQKARADARNP